MDTETVKNHKMRIMKKMNLQRIEDMMRYAVQYGCADRSLFEELPVSHFLQPQKNIGQE